MSQKIFFYKVWIMSSKMVCEMVSWSLGLYGTKFTNSISTGLYMWLFSFIKDKHHSRNIPMLITYPSQETLKTMVLSSWYQYTMPNCVHLACNVQWQDRGFIHKWQTTLRCPIEVFALLRLIFRSCPNSADLNMSSSHQSVLALLWVTDLHLADIDWRWSH